MIAAGFLEPGRLRHLLERQSSEGGRLGSLLVTGGGIAEAQLLEILARQSSTPGASSAELLSASAEALSHLSPTQAEALGVVPFRVEDGVLHYATSSPRRLATQFALRELARYPVREHVAVEARLRQALSRHYGTPLSLDEQRVIERLQTEPAADHRPRPIRNDSDSSDDSRRALPGSGPSQAHATRSNLRASLPHPPTRELSAAARSLAEEPASEIHRDRELTADREPAEEGRGGDPEATQGDLALWAALRREIGTAGPSDPTWTRSPTADTTSTEVWLEEEDEAQRFHEFAARLRRAKQRDEIGDLLLDYSSRWFRRRLLLYRRDGRFCGWRADGAGVSPHLCLELKLEISSSPELTAAIEGQAVLTEGTEPSTLLAALGGVPALESALLPIRLGSRVALLLYADSLREPVQRAAIPYLSNLGRAAADSLLELARQNRALRSGVPRLDD